MSKTLQNALENHLCSINKHINFYSKYILRTFLYYTNTDYLLWSLKTTHSDINKPKGEDYYVYYSYITIWKILWIALCIIILLLMVFYIKDACPSVQSEDMFTRSIELVQCDNFIMLIFLFIIITLSYILGGYIRVFGMVGFIIIGISISLKPENIRKLSTSIQNIYTGVVQENKTNTKNNINLNSKKKVSKKTKIDSKSKVSKKENNDNKFFNRYINPYSNQPINNTPYYNNYNILTQPFYR